AAASDLPLETVGADHPALHRVVGRRRTAHLAEQLLHPRARRIEQRSRLRMTSQERLDATTDVEVVSTGRIQERRPFRGRDLDGLMEEVLDAVPDGVVHGPDPSVPVARRYGWPAGRGR